MLVTLQRKATPSSNAWTEKKRLARIVSRFAGQRRRRVRWFSTTEKFSPGGFFGGVGGKEGERFSGDGIGKRPAQNSPIFRAEKGACRSRWKKFKGKKRKPYAPGMWGDNFPPIVSLEKKGRRSPRSEEAWRLEKKKKEKMMASTLP